MFKTKGEKMYYDQRNCKNNYENGCDFKREDKEENCGCCFKLNQEFCCYPSYYNEGKKEDKKSEEKKCECRCCECSNEQKHECCCNCGCSYGRKNDRENEKSCEKDHDENGRNDHNCCRRQGGICCCFRKFWG